MLPLVGAKSYGIHGTNKPYLFKRKYRSLSHGCIRAKEITNIVKFIIENVPHSPDVTMDKILDYTKKKKSIHIKLKKDVLVKIK